MIKLGDKFSVPFIINSTVYHGFINIFGDRNPLHTNAKFAINKGFEGKVMHGNILNGFLSYFIGECLPLKNVIIQHQTIKFNRPVYLNDELILNVEVVEINETVNTYLFKYYFQNTSINKVAKGEIRISLLL